MENYTYNYQLQETLAEKEMIKVGVAGSGNLDVEIKSNVDNSQTIFNISTNVSGFKDAWDAVIERFVADHPYQGIIYNIHDAGATPAVVALRLRQAIETYQTDYHVGKDYLELNGRERVHAILDKQGFKPILLDYAGDSPNLPLLNIQTESDDGVITAVGNIGDNKIAMVAQQKDFIGGAVGEIHGAKINGLIQYAIKHQLDAVVLLVDSGGVRLQEANVGEIEISEIIRSILEARTAGVKTIAVVCGKNGAYGGMGIITGSVDTVIVNQTARIGVSGAEVIQAVEGAEAFDASDRPLMWRVYGGRTRYMQQAAKMYISNKISDVQAAITKAITDLDKDKLLDLSVLKKQHSALKQRIESTGEFREQGEYVDDLHIDSKAIFNMNDSEFIKISKEIIK